MILPWLISEWPADAREDYEERAAILQYDARLPKDRAEAIAEEWCRKAHRARPAAIDPRDGSA